MNLVKAVLGAAVAGIALAGSTATRAEPPVYVTLRGVPPMLLWWPPTSVLCFLGGESSLGGANKILGFEALGL